MSGSKRLRAAGVWIVLRGGRLSFVAAWGLDLAREWTRRLAGRSCSTQVIGGVTFPLPPNHYRKARAFCRNRVLLVRHQSACVRWPYPWVRAGPDPADLAPPMILATFHMGPVWALGSLVAQLPGPVCVLKGAGQLIPRKATYVAAVGGEAQRAAAVTEAVHTLRAGGYVLVVADRLGNAPVHQLVLGRWMAFAGGAFALARLAGAPLVPLAVRWHGPTVKIVAGPAIAPAAEAAMASSLSRWLEQYLRDHPSELSFPLSQRLGRSADVPVGS